MVANPWLTGFTAPKLLWVRKVEPANWDRVGQVLLPKDYVRYRLTGTFATEVSDASGTLLLDVVNRRWCRELLGKLGVDPSLLPPVTKKVGGVLSVVGERDRIKAAGVPKGTPVVGGGRPPLERWATGCTSARGWSRRRWGPRAWFLRTPTSPDSTRWAASNAAATRCRVPGA